MSTCKPSPPFPPLTGHCACRAVTYTLTAAPLITHCCHCTYCQLETGSAFALNSAIERYHFIVTSATQPVLANRPSPSAADGAKHRVAHCPNPDCNVHLFAYYGGNEVTVYVKTGTLDQRSRGRVRPDVHMFTSTKVEWVDVRSEVEWVDVRSEVEWVDVRSEVEWVDMRSEVEWVDVRSEVERGVSVCEEFYDRGEVWSPESLERLERLSEWKAQQGK